MESYLALIWAGLIAFAVLAYVLLDGFDLGIGIAVFFGGVVGEKLSMQTAYLTGVVLLVVSFLYFRFFVAAHYEANKIVQ